MTSLYFTRYGMRTDWVFYDAHDKSTGRHFMIVWTPYWTSGTAYTLTAGEHPNILYHVDWVDVRVQPDEMKKHLTKWANGEVVTAA
jgi:hypothetical protein